VAGIQRAIWQYYVYAYRDQIATGHVVTESGVWSANDRTRPDRPDIGLTLFPAGLDRKRPLRGLISAFVYIRDYRTLVSSATLPR
jgi:hypothetical protein